MKRLCAKAALKLVPDQGRIGLGGGETIGYLAEYIKEAGKRITIITPSDATKKKCQKLGLTVEETENVSEIDIAFDGCDQVDSRLNAYKSAGGIHTREKIIARMAAEYVLLADETKVTEELGYDIPVVLEIIPEAREYIKKEIKKMGGTVRERERHLLEVLFEGSPSLEAIDRKLKQMTGVVETSLFYQIASKAVIAGENSVRIMKKAGGKE